MTAAMVLQPDVDLDIETPQERAQRRVEELRLAASGVLEVLAQIYLDEDWKYLSDDTGEPFSGFTQFVQYTLGGSASNARRYRQGVETLVAPLQEITAAGTRIPVTPNDIVRLGRAGAQAVLEAAPTALSGITENSAQTSALRGLLDEVIAEHQTTLGQVPGRALPEIPTTVPSHALTAGAEDRDPWGSDPDSPTHTGAEYVEETDHADSAECAALRNALEQVLALDPVTAAGDTTAAHGVRVAADCLSAAQRLARIAQLLKALQ